MPSQNGVRITNEAVWGEFRCGGGSVSVWVQD
jgi:hypothetical protein